MIPSNKDLNEIDRLSYMEMFKKKKDLHLIYQPDNPQIIELNKFMNEILERYDTNSSG